MAGRRTKLNAEVHAAIVAYMRAGAFAWVAAEAAGIDKSTLYRWLERGAREATGHYRDFAADVRQAQAQARVTAEVQVRQEQPLAWLRYGPGRARPDAPGWTDGHEVATEVGRLEITFEIGGGRGRE